MLYEKTQWPELWLDGIPVRKMRRCRLHARRLPQSELGKSALHLLRQYAAGTRPPIKGRHSRHSKCQKQFSPKNPAGVADLRRDFQVFIGRMPRVSPVILFCCTGWDGS